MTSSIRPSFRGSASPKKSQSPSPAAKGPSVTVFSTTLDNNWRCVHCFRKNNAVAAGDRCDQCHMPRLAERRENGEAVNEASRYGPTVASPNRPQTNEWPCKSCEFGSNDPSTDHCMVCGEKRATTPDRPVEKLSNSPALNQASKDPSPTPNSQVPDVEDKKAYSSPGPPRKQISETPVDGWTCAQCTYVNESWRPGCQVCSADSPDNVEIASAIPGESVKGSSGRSRNNPVGQTPGKVNNVSGPKNFNQGAWTTSSNPVKLKGAAEGSADRFKPNVSSETTASAAPKNQLPVEKSKKTAPPAPQSNPFPAIGRGSQPVTRSQAGINESLRNQQRGDQLSDTSNVVRSGSGASNRQGDRTSGRGAKDSNRNA